MAYFGIVGRRKHLLTKKNIAAWLTFTKLSLNKPQDVTPGIKDGGRVMIWAYFAPMGTSES